MKNKRKRFTAFLIDMLLITILTSLISSLSYMNPYYSKYEKAANEGVAYLQEVLGGGSNIDNEEYTNKISNINYQMTKYNSYTVLWYLIFYVLYYVLFQFYNGGQTLGKKICKIKIVREDGGKAGVLSYLVRGLFNGCTFFMGFNLFAIISLILVNTLNKTTFLNVNSYIELMSYTIQAVCLILYVVNKDSRTINDYISKTTVIDK